MTRRIRSSRAIAYNTNHSIDFMWLASGRCIDHTTLSEFRRKHGEQLKGIQRQMIETAIDMSLARLSELCIDGTRILANANRYKTWTADKVEKLLIELDRQINDALKDLDTNDSMEDLFNDGQSANKCPPKLADLKARRAKIPDKRGDRTVKQIVYRCEDCDDCPLAAMCRKNPEAERGRKVSHNEHDDGRRCHREHICSLRNHRLVTRTASTSARLRLRTRQKFDASADGSLNYSFFLRLPFVPSPVIERSKSFFCDAPAVLRPLAI